MGIVKPSPVCSSSKKSTFVFSQTKTPSNPSPTVSNTNQNSMSQQHQQEYHQQQAENIFGFSNGYERSSASIGHQDQIRRDNTKLRGFEPNTATLVSIDQTPPAHDPDSDPSTGLHPVYETGGMLSEMFNFGHGPGPGPGPGPAPSPEMLDYRRAVGGLASEWYGGNRQVARDNIGDHHHHSQQQQQQQHNNEPPPPPPPQPHHHHQIPSINAADSAAAMQLFLTNPPPRSPSPPHQPPQQSASGSTLHMLLPSPSSIQPGGGAGAGGGFHSLGVNNPNYWGAPGPGGAAHINNSHPGELGGIVEGQGLSLSLSSSLQHLEAAKQAEELRNIGGGDSHIMFFNQHQQGGVGQSSSTTASPAAHHFFKNLVGAAPPHNQHQQPQILHGLQTIGGFGGPNNQHQVHHLGFGSPSTASSSIGGAVNALRNSRFAKPAQELLEEFCSVGRGHLKKGKLTRQNSSNPNPNPNPSTSGGGGAGSSSSTKDPAQLSASDRIEHQRRKVKLLSMLDEVDRRYNHYCEQMQMVVNSFDLVMGYGAAIPYTALAQKAMSRHFRCLKDAIQEQLRQSCEVLGEKDPTASSGLTKGETPRLKLLEQSLRQQRAFHQMGMMEQEAWRPQRGLPERSVNILRAWLFEHFLHPYPSDADKHLLARQTGLSRNQVSNWFINARVRLWKPMVEDMYQQEAKEAEEEEERERNQTSSSTTSNTNTNTNTNTSHSHSLATQQAQNPMPSSSSATPTTANASTTMLTTTTTATEGKRSGAETLTGGPPPDADPSQPSPAINRHHHLNHHNHQQQPPLHATGLPPGVSHSQAFLHGVDDTCQFGGDPDNVGPTTMIRFGTTTGDVSLTLGLRHAGNAPEKSAAFSVRDFGSC